MVVLYNFDLINYKNAKWIINYPIVCLTLFYFLQVIAAKLLFNQLTASNSNNNSSSNSNNTQQDINKLLRFLSVFHERLHRVELLFSKDRLYDAVVQDSVEVDAKLVQLIRDMNISAATAIVGEGDANISDGTSSNAK